MSSQTNGITAEELDRLTVEDIKQCSYIKMQDGAQVTGEQLGKLRDLIQQASEAEQSNPLDTNALNTKLHAIAASSPTSSRSTTPEMTDEMHQAEVVAKYNKLIAMGGRPRRSLNFVPGPWDPSGRSWEKFHVADHWFREAHTFMPELRRWTAFREYQQHVRADVQRFPEYQQYIRDYRTKHELPGPVDLCLQSDQQTKVDEWKEYQVWIHRELRRKEDNLKRAQQGVDAAYQRLEAADTAELRWGIKANLPIHQAEVSGAEMELQEMHEQVVWVEQQLPIIAREELLARPAKELKPQRRSQWATATSQSSDPHQDPLKTRARGCDGVQVSREQSMLRPRHGSKIFKPRNRRWHPPVKEHQVCAGSQTASLKHGNRDTGACMDPPTSNVSLRRSKRISSARKPAKALDRPLHSPKISKSTTTRSRNSRPGHTQTAARRNDGSQFSTKPIPAKDVLHHLERDAGYTEPKSSALDEKGRIESHPVKVSVRRSKRLSERRQ